MDRRRFIATTAGAVAGGGLWGGLLASQLWTSGTRVSIIGEADSQLTLLDDEGTRMMILTGTLTANLSRGLDRMLSFDRRRIDIVILDHRRVDLALVELIRRLQPSVAISLQASLDAPGLGFETLPVTRETRIALTPTTSVVASVAAPSAWDATRAPDVAAIDWMIGIEHGAVRIAVWSAANLPSSLKRGADMVVCPSMPELVGSPLPDVVAVNSRKVDLAFDEAHMLPIYSESATDIHLRNQNLVLPGSSLDRS